MIFRFQTEKLEPSNLQPLSSSEKTLFDAIGGRGKKITLLLAGSFFLERKLILASRELTHKLLP